VPKAGRNALFCLLLLLGPIGCPSPPAPVEPEPERHHRPGVRTHMVYDFDHPFSEASVAAVTTRAKAPTNALALSVSMLGLAELREGIAEPLSKSARMIVTHEGQNPLLVAPDLFADAQASWYPSPSSLRAWLEAGRAGATSELAEFDGVLVPGTSAIFEIEAASVAPVGSARAVRAAALRLWVHRRTLETDTADTLELALAIEGPGSSFDAAQGTDRWRHECVLLESRPLQGSQAGFVAILPFRGPKIEAIAVLVQIKTAPKEGEELKTYETACQNWARLFAPREGPGPTRDLIHFDSEDLKERLRTLCAEASPLAHRRALAALASQRRARLACELALAGEDPLIEAIAQHVANAPRGPAEDLGKTLERAALEAVAAQAKAAGELQDSLLAQLIDYAGAVTDPAQLLACLSASADLEEHERRIVESNRRFLNDPAPWLQGRARAWLATHEQDR
jgi:hypothetical protein